MADKYKSTLLAQNNDPLEIQKADLDLLKKINEVQKNVESISIPEGLNIEEKIEIVKSEKPNEKFKEIKYGFSHSGKNEKSELDELEIKLEKSRSFI